jgi:hypothetical protein
MTVMDLGPTKNLIAGNTLIVPEAFNVVDGMSSSEVVYTPFLSFVF